MRGYILSNLIATLERMPLVPVGVVVEPAIKQFALYGYSSTDFDFILALARHPRLVMRHAIMLMDLLGKICINDPLFGRIASVPFLIMLNRFHFEPLVLQYVGRYAQVCLSMLMHVEEMEAKRAEREANPKNAPKSKGPLWVDPVKKERGASHVRRTPAIAVACWLRCVSISASRCLTPARASLYASASLLRRSTRLCVSMAD